MVERSLAVLDKELAKLVTLLPELDVRLVRIDAAKRIDEYHVLQGLQDSSSDEEAFYYYQRWGQTGSSGNKKINGPFSEKKMREEFAKVFEERTGAAWGSLKPGDRVPDGRFWWQRGSLAEEKAFWQYYVHDGVDGKKRGWYPYEDFWAKILRFSVLFASSEHAQDDASAEVEEIFAQHMSNDQESRTAIRTVSSGTVGAVAGAGPEVSSALRVSCCSGYFSYKIDLEAMTQENTKTGKVRAIRRFTEATKHDTSAPKKPRGAPKKKAPVDRKKVKKTILKASTATSVRTKAGKPELAKTAMKALKLKAMKSTSKASKGRKVVKAAKAAKVAKGKDAKAQVFHGKFKRTSTGLKKEDLKKNKYGKVVTKKQSEAGRYLGL